VNAPRPLALGYIREVSPLSEAEVAEATQDLAEFAEREGYALGTVYVERLEQTPAAFEALVASAIREEAVAVVVPGPHQIALIGAASAIRGRCALDDPLDDLLDDPLIPRSGEAGVPSTTRPHVDVRARLAVPTGSPRRRDLNHIPGAGEGARAGVGDSLPVDDNADQTSGSTGMPGGR